MCQCMCIPAWSWKVSMPFAGKIGNKSLMIVLACLQMLGNDMIAFTKRCFSQHAELATFV